MIKPGVIIIDAGTAESGSSIVGDVDFEGVSGLARFISPVPGGVGPVTVAKLLENVVTVAESDPGLLT
jgi:methylenetetrahydrofolate dehydrogenase (NADP+)/methenyltetrahydrofolate cyclohydrolase